MCICTCLVVKYCLYTYMSGEDSTVIPVPVSYIFVSSQAIVASFTIGCVFICKYKSVDDAQDQDVELIAQRKQLIWLGLMIMYCTHAYVCTYVVLHSI